MDYWSNWEFSWNKSLIYEYRGYFRKLKRKGIHKNITNWIFGSDDRMCFEWLD